MSMEPVEPREETEPLTYASVQAGARWRPLEPPGRALHACLMCAAISIAAAALVLLVPHPIMCLLNLPAWVLAAGALVQGALAIWRNGDPRLAAPQRRSFARLFAALGLSLALFIGQAWLALAELSAAREYGKSAVSASNLRAIGQALLLYAEERGEYPGSFDDLVSAGTVTPSMLVTPVDSAFVLRQTAPHYSSFVCRSGVGVLRVDAALILAYQRAAIQPLSPRAFTGHGRAVLFGDGTVRVLDDEAFTEALQKDEQRRQELGWPLAARP